MMHEGVKLSSRTVSHVRLALSTAEDTAPRSPHAASLLRPETGPQICSSAPIPGNRAGGVGAGVCVELHGEGVRPDIRSRKPPPLRAKQNQNHHLTLDLASHRKSKQHMKDTVLWMLPCVPSPSKTDLGHAFLTLRR